MSCGEDKLVIGYWKIRGLGAVLRMLMSYVNEKRISNSEAAIPFEFKNYDCVKTESGWDRSRWLDEKKKLIEINPIINLPYVQQGNIVITQSNPCLTFLARLFSKYDLMGKEETDIQRIEQMVAQSFDLRSDVIGPFYTSVESVTDYIENKKYFITHHVHCTLVKLILFAFTYNDRYDEHYQKFENWLSKYKFQFIAANYVTAADFALWELIDEIEIGAKNFKLQSPLSSYSHLSEYYQRFFEVPELQTYFQSDSYFFPCNQPFSAHSFSAERK